MPAIDPPRYSADELDAFRGTALSAFVAAWGVEGSRRYTEEVERLSSLVQELFQATRDLRDLSSQTFIADVARLNAARYLTAPPVSADDMKTLIGGTLTKKVPDRARAEKAATVVRAAWDPLRFPWLLAGSDPTEAQRKTAVTWTASIWAIEAMRTYKRMSSAKQQEQLVAAALEASGFQPAPRRSIEHLEDLDRGKFMRETMLGLNKADVPIRLMDGRLLALECKVSNSAVNSKKRLNNDVGAKSAYWTKTFGERVITGAVLAGVYSLGNLLTAQDNQNVTLFWAHDLSPLITFVQAAVP